MLHSPWNGKHRRRSPSIKSSVVDGVFPFSYLLPVYSEYRLTGLMIAVEIKSVL